MEHFILRPLQPREVEKTLIQWCTFSFQNSMQLRSRTSVNVEYATITQQLINALKWKRLKL
jgi:hypothetical protein